MEDVVLIIIIAAFFAVCYIAFVRFSRIVEKTRRDTRKYLAEEPEEKEQPGNGRPHKSEEFFHSENKGPHDGAGGRKMSDGTDCR